MALRRLTSDLPAELLRGVPSDRALQGYGWHWKGNAGGPEDFGLSVVAEDIDDFISHDWRTPRSVKYVTLCYIYNSRVALIGSTLFAVFVVLVRELLKYARVLQRASDNQVFLPDLVACVSVGPFAYLLLLFHWHHIRARLGKVSLLFVDKLCICQHDENMKRDGILGLAAFLKQSKRIIVLWSPTYFSRLWCTYELAAWFRFEKATSSVVFVPVGIPPFVIVMLLFSAVEAFLLYSEEVIMVELYQWPSMQILVCIVWAQFLQAHAAHVDSLTEQLDTFSIQTSSCFCCSHAHVHPTSGAPLSCDRALVYETIKQWMWRSDCCTREEEHLTGFNSEVRTTLKSYVTSKLPERRSFLTYADMLHLQFSTLWCMIDLLVLRGHAWRRLENPSRKTAVLCVEGFGIVFFVIPLSLAAVVRLMRLTRRWLATRRLLLQVLLSCCFWGPIGFVTQGFLWALIHADFYMEDDHTLPFLCVPMVLQALLVYWIFRSEKKGGDAFAVEEHFSLSRSRTEGRSTAFGGRATTYGQEHSSGGGQASLSVIQADSIVFQDVFSENPIEAPTILFDSVRNMAGPQEQRRGTEHAGFLETAACLHVPSNSGSIELDLISLCSV
eukprot:TRINITY_DN18118_c0_g1_i2.p1 TRINITY_DN18118_c0_g1~~TRINITY_DN18118_c0_g1_i2.p1  ORF type:complete len:611 (+),score=34.01 TRINITY_DN18118_c0_g1_i2:114-1946(+)